MQLKLTSSAYHQTTMTDFKVNINN